MEHNEPLIELDLDANLTQEMQTANPICSKSLSFMLPQIGRRGQEAAQSLTLIKERKVKRHILSHQAIDSLFERFLSKESHEAKHPEESQASIIHSIHHKQFVQIQNILEMSLYSKSEKRKIIDFVEELLYRNETGHSTLGVTETLAKLIFLLSEPKSFSLAVEHGIHSAFNTALKRMHKRLKKVAPTPLAYQMVLPIILADALILKDGTLNTGLIPFLIKEFVTASTHNFGMTLKSGLQLLHQSLKIQEKIEAVHPPSTFGTASEFIIRAALQLNTSLPITDREAKIAILSAFLTHLRQGLGGSCFACFIAIEQQAMHPNQVLDDLCSLVENDGLIRTVDGKKQQFPYLLPTIRDGDTQHPLLKAWENSIAGMSEAKKGSLLKSALIHTVNYVFVKRAEKVKILSSAWHEGIPEKIEKLLEERVQYLYDSDYVNPGGSVQPGAFILFETKNQVVRKLDNSQAFQQFVKETILEVLPPDMHIFFEEYLNNPKTLKTLLKKYHPSNYNYLAERGSMEILPYCPWKTQIGNDPKMVYQIYHEVPAPFKTVEMKPDHAEELLQDIHGLLENKPDRFAAPMVPIRIQGVHTFSLLPQHPSLKPYYYEWKPLGNARYYSEMPLLKSLVKKVNSWILDKFLKPDERASFLAQQQELPKANTLGQYRNQTLNLLRDFVHSEYSYSSTKTKLDYVIFQSLPKKLRKEIESNIVIFADSNWQEGIHDIHYGIGCNPASGQIELLALLDNGTIHKFLNQNSYFKTHTWELAI